MLPTTNAIVTIYGLQASGNKRTLTTLGTASAYINQNGEEINAGLGGEGAFFGHRMLTDGNHAAINVGGRVTDGTGKHYDVRGKAVFSDATGTHHQYLISEAYD